MVLTCFHPAAAFSTTETLPWLATLVRGSTRTGVPDVGLRVALRRAVAAPVADVHPAADHDRQYGATPTGTRASTSPPAKLQPQKFVAAVTSRPTGGVAVEGQAGGVGRAADGRGRHGQGAAPRRSSRGRPPGDADVPLGVGGEHAVAGRRQADDAEPGRLPLGGRWAACAGRAPVAGSRKTRSRMFLTTSVRPPSMSSKSTGRPGKVTCVPAGRRIWLVGTTMRPSGWRPTLRASRGSAAVAAAANASEKQSKK